MQKLKLKLISSNWLCFLLEQEFLNFLCWDFLLIDREYFITKRLSTFSKRTLKKSWQLNIFSTQQSEKCSHFHAKKGRVIICARADALMLILEKLLYVSPWFLVCHVVTHNGFGQCCTMWLLCLLLMHMAVKHKLGRKPINFTQQMPKLVNFT